MFSHPHGGIFDLRRFILLFGKFFQQGQPSFHIRLEDQPSGFVRHSAQMELRHPEDGRLKVLIRSFFIPYESFGKIFVGAAAGFQTAGVIVLRFGNSFIGSFLIPVNRQGIVDGPVFSVEIFIAEIECGFSVPGRRLHPQGIVPRRLAVEDHDSTEQHCQRRIF